MSKEKMKKYEEVLTENEMKNFTKTKLSFMLIPVPLFFLSVLSNYIWILPIIMLICYFIPNMIVHQRYKRHVLEKNKE